MTDEMTIQAVQPQIQRSNPMAYGIGGALAGGAIGAAGAHYYKKSGSEGKTLEELLKEVEEKDKFELTSKNDDVKKAQAALDEASKPVIEGKEKEALAKAIKERDAELAKLTESKTTTTSGSKIFTPKPWDKLKLNGKDYPTFNERTGKDFKTDDMKTWEKNVKAEYERLVRDYNSAVSKFEAKSGSKDTVKLNKYKMDIQAYLDASRCRYGNTKTNKLDQIFTTELGWGKHTAEYYKAEDVAKKIIPDVPKDTSRLSDKQLLSFAERLEKGATVPSGYRTKTVYEVVDGKRQPVKLGFSSDMFNEFRKTENAKLVDQRTELIDSLLGRARENIELQKRAEPNKFMQDFINTIPDSQAEQSGLFSTAKNGRKEINIAGIINEAVDKKGHKGKPDFYDADLTKVKKLIDKEGSSYTKMPSGLKGKYGTPKDLQALEDMITTRKEVLKSFNQEKRDLAKEIRACLDDHAIIKNLEEKIETARSADEGIADAKEKLFNQFKTLTDASGSTTTTTKAGLTQAEAMEKESYKKLAKIADDAKAAYEKVAAEKGAVNETNKKAAQDALESAKNALKTKMEELGAKAKGLSGSAKIGIAAATAVVGALIGAGIANSKNNKAAEQAERQIIA